MSKEAVCLDPRPRKCGFSSEKKGECVCTILKCYPIHKNGKCPFYKTKDRLLQDEAQYPYNPDFQFI